MTDDKQPAAERLLKARESVAKEFGLDIDDWRTKRLALLMAVHSQAEDAMANGKSVDINGLLALDESIAKVRESIKATEPISINVKFVKGYVGIADIVCPHCQKHSRHEISKRPFDDKSATPPAEERATSHDNGSQGPSVAPGTPDAPSDAQPAANVVPIGPKVTYRPHVSASSFHSAVINNRTVPPLKKEQRPHHYSESAERDRHPYRDAAGGDRVAHPLPVPHGVIW